MHYLADRGFERQSKQKQSFDLYEEMGNFTMNVIASCAFATDINAHTESDNIFVRNAKELFDFDLIRISITFIVPQKLHEWLNWMRVPFFHMKTQEFFKNLSFFLIEQRRNDPENQPNDILQLMINARFKSIRSSTNLIDQTDSSTDLFNVEQDVDEIEQERKLFTEIVGRKYLSENEIAAQSWVFFLAGYETTASTLTYCIYELTINQNIQQKLFDEIQAVLNRNQSFDYENLINLPYLDAVLSETMRKYPPLLTTGRRTEEDYHLKEFALTIPRGMDIYIPIYAVHHDPEYYPDPERYDPERFMPENRHKLVPYTYLPFGGGPRNCIGMRFALAEAKLALANLLINFRFIKSSQTTEKLRLINSFFLTKSEPIFISVERRLK
ncbi:Cytochrome P450 3A11 [Sarcoptes scabiei]|uniref:Cytochrome P450 3A11 n=1 Tax=Sarcoptes scabiei TaxID=52283 RepID=A0A834R8I4_SARSC|nr:Cytochrome P450 3A11 [Sarcoptes scabiei]